MSVKRNLPRLNGFDINRRHFLKQSALAAGGLALGKYLISPLPWQPISPPLKQPTALDYVIAPSSW